MYHVHVINLTYAHYSCQRHSILQQLTYPGIPFLPNDTSNSNGMHSRQNVLTLYHVNVASVSSLCHQQHWHNINQLSCKHSFMSTIDILNLCFALTQNGLTALFLAVEKDCIEVIQLLISKGANVQAASNVGDWHICECNCLSIHDVHTAIVGIRMISRTLHGCNDDLTCLQHLATSIWHTLALNSLQHTLAAVFKAQSYKCIATCVLQLYCHVCEKTNTPCRVNQLYNVSDKLLVMVWIRLTYFVSQG